MTKLEVVGSEKNCFAVLKNFARAAGKYVSVRKRSVLQLKLQQNFRLCMMSWFVHEWKNSPSITNSSLILWLLPDVIAFQKQTMYLNCLVCIFFCSAGFRCDVDIERMC